MAGAPIVIKRQWRAGHAELLQCGPLGDFFTVMCSAAAAIAPSTATATDSTLVTAEPNPTDFQSMLTTATVRRTFSLRTGSAYTVTHTSVIIAAIWADFFRLGACCALWAACELHTACTTTVMQLLGCHYILPAAPQQADGSPLQE